MENIGKYYGKVRLIVLKQQKQYGIQLWEKEDWEQEGLICLYQLLTSHPELRNDDEKLRIYFKTKFSNYVKDQLRAQGSLKRRINNQTFEDVHELEYLIEDPRMAVENYLIFQECYQAFKKQLTTREEHEQLEKVVAGEVFRGRKAMLHRMETYFEDVSK